MTTVSTSFTAVGVSATLRLQEIGEDVTIAISGTYNTTIVLERALTPTAVKLVETVVIGKSPY